MLKAEYKERGPVPQDVIEAVTFEMPPLQAGQVLLELLASPINPSDVLTLTGQYGILPPLPAVGGNEGVGKVIALGPEVAVPAIGQTVLLPVGKGAWATHHVAEAKTLIPLPSEVDPIQLSMLTINPPTAWLMLESFVALQPGDWVIQNAANSAVGHYVIALAKAKGLKTVNLVRRESLIEPLLASGADLVLVDNPSAEQSLAEQVAQATGQAPIKLGIDAVGGTATTRLGECLAPHATLVNYGAMSGEPAVLTPQLLIFKSLTVKGFWLAEWFRSATPEQQQAVFAELTTLMVAGKLSAPVHATYPIAEIKTAVAEASRTQRDGKVVLVGDSLKPN